MNNAQETFSWIGLTIRDAAWAPIAVFLTYLLGLSLHLYNVFPYLDIPTHFMGGVAITYFYRAAIRRSQQYLGDIPLPIQIIFAFTATGTTAVLWEFCENILDYLLRTHMVRGLTDTLTDLLAGISGALVLSLFYRKR